jgi:hypothetical protein
MQTDPREDETWLISRFGLSSAQAASGIELDVNTLAGTDSVRSAGLGAGAIQFFLDGIRAL